MVAQIAGCFHVVDIEDFFFKRGAINYAYIYVAQLIRFVGEQGHEGL